MKKKSLLTMVLALTLVGAVGIGATLAYMSDTTTELKNTFTVGSGIDIKQDESNEDTPDDPTDRTEEGNDYTDIMPGDVLVKDPTVTIEANSTDCYVFMLLDGADELADITVKDADGNDVAAFAFGTLDADGKFVEGLSADWTKVSGDANSYDGLYVYENYTVVEKNEDAQPLTALFTRVQYNINADLAEDVELADVIIKSCAVQADNMTDETALAAAVDAFGIEETSTDAQ